jgi:hypothetical protein
VKTGLNISDWRVIARFLTFLVIRCHKCSASCKLFPAIFILSTESNVASGEVTNICVAFNIDIKDAIEEGQPFNLFCPAKQNPLKNQVE